jgi:uncharacterized phage protein gp47/JayE
MSLINNRTPEQILNDFVTIFQATQPDVNINEASVIYILGQVFSFISGLNVSTAQDFALSAFIADATGDDLTALAADRGITRITAKYATVPLIFSRTVIDPVNSYTIMASSSVSTQIDENGNYYEFKIFDTVVLSASSTSVTAFAQAINPGADYNVIANTITNFITNITGVDTVTNTSDAIGGDDEETDADLRARIITTLQSNGARNTVSGYQNSLLSFGCKTAYVYSPSGTMPNYINAVVTSNDTANTIPTSGELSNWQFLINGDDYRAVADVITVMAPTAITITVSAKIIEYSISSDPNTVRNLLQQSIIDYINTLPPGSDVYKNSVMALCHNQDGVIDFEFYLPASNITIGQTEKAIADSSSVTIT